MPAPTTAELVALYGEPDGMSDRPSNTERVGWGWAALVAHHTACGNGVDVGTIDEPQPDTETLISDAISDLLHVAAHFGFDATAAHERGWRDFVAEVGTGYDDPTRTIPRPAGDGLDGTVVIDVGDCEVVLTPHGFYARCRAGNCTWVTSHTAARHRARNWAQGHVDGRYPEGVDPADNERK